MTTTAHDLAATALKAQLRGALIRPGDAGYDTARAVWNGMIDRRPAVIVRPDGVEDVIAAVNLARESGLPLAVRGGGHNAAGLAVCDDGIVIDLTSMKAVEVDPVARTARVQGGATWGDLDAATAAHGLATTGGLISSTGVGGLTLGGGLGWLMRRYGLACDNLLSVEVVTADGRLSTASEAENPGLFWGLRGGGGNFGVATSFQFRLHPVRTVLAGMLVHPIERAGEVLRLYRDVTANAADALTIFAPVMTTPEGEKVIALIVCYDGAIAEGEIAIERLREFAPALVDTVMPMEYVDLQRMLDEAFPHGLQVYWRAHFLSDLPDAAIDALLERFAGVTSPLTAVIVEPMGGAVSRVSRDATAFDQRNAAYNLAIVARWMDPAEADGHIAWARELWEVLRPYASGVYVNYLGVGDGAERVRDAYGPAKYARLAALKAAYDPSNLFHLNQNNAPSG
jgi:FAD/FMN-containing dehydrogenase